MRRTLMAALAASALTLAVPGAALARHATRHSSSHSRHHRRHAHTVRFVAGAIARPRTTTAVKTTATTVTTTTTTETPGETVGTVLSFEGGVLKLTLGDGSVVSGKLTEATELSCVGAAEGQQGQQGDESKGDDEGGEGDEGSHGEAPAGSWPGGDQGPAQGHGDAMSQGAWHADGPGGEGGEGSCTVAALVPGAKVQEAELTITSAGAVWEKVRIAQ